MAPKNRDNGNKGKGGDLIAVNGEETALVLVDRGFMLARYTEAAMRETIAENFGSGGMDPGLLDRVRVPAGGGLVWEVSGLEGPQAAKSIEGVIVQQARRRAYWASNFAASGGTPPDCFSTDGDNGQGSPGGQCAACPLNVFGSASNDKRGKACKEMKLLYVLRAESLLPVVLVVPPSSLRRVQQYLTRLTAAGKRFRAVISGVALEKAQNADGIGYAEIVLSFVADLDPESAARIQSYAKSLGDALSTSEAGRYVPTRGDVAEAAQ